MQIIIIPQSPVNFNNIGTGLCRVYCMKIASKFCKIDCRGFEENKLQSFFL
jgi:hypothetical protein